MYGLARRAHTLFFAVFRDGPQFQAGWRVGVRRGCLFFASACFFRASIVIAHVQSCVHVAVVLRRCGPGTSGVRRWPSRPCAWIPKGPSPCTAAPTSRRPEASWLTSGERRVQRLLNKIGLRERRRVRTSPCTLPHALPFPTTPVLARSTPRVAPSSYERYKGSW